MNAPTKNTSLRKMIGIVSLAVTALVVLAVCLKVDDWSRDWTENRAEQSFDVSDVMQQELAESICDWVGQRKGWEVVTVKENTDAWQIELTRSTSVLGFTDDIDLSLKRTKSGVTIDAVSQSRIGKGDLGQNPRNLAELAQAWQ